MRIEKILHIVLHEAHKGQVEVTTHTLDEGSEGHCCHAVIAVIFGACALCCASATALAAVLLLEFRVRVEGAAPSPLFTELPTRAILGNPYTALRIVTR